MQMERALKLSICSKFLIVGGIIAAATACWHLLCILGGPSWYAFARAPHIVVKSAREGTILAPVGAIAIASLMLVCTIYSFSGAGLIKKIPLLKSALITISIICLARALVTVPYLIQGKLDMWNLIAGFGWFFVGICFFMGAIEQVFLKSNNV